MKNYLFSSKQIHEEMKFMFNIRNTAGFLWKYRRIKHHFVLSGMMPKH